MLLRRGRGRGGGVRGPAAAQLGHVHEPAPRAAAARLAAHRARHRRQCLGNLTHLASLPPFPPTPRSVTRLDYCAALHTLSEYSWLSNVFFCLHSFLALPGIIFRLFFFENVPLLRCSFLQAFISFYYYRIFLLLVSKVVVKCQIEFYVSIYCRLWSPPLLQSMSFFERRVH